MLKIEKNRKLIEETVNLNSDNERKNEIKEKNTEEKEKTSAEIGKLKEEIDSLAISLKVFIKYCFFPKKFYFLTIFFFKLEITIVFT